jgi:hypothetical protein
MRGEPGPLLFARYAIPPNALAHCGGDEPQTMLEHVREGVVDPDLVRLVHEFKGAWPYLSLIASQNGIADPLDRRVVEAYWIGGSLLNGVSDGALAADLEARFSSRLRPGERKWLLDAPQRGLPAHHNVHVLSVMPHIGLLRAGVVPDLVDALGNCLVRPARVKHVRPDGLTVEARPVESREGHFVLGSVRPEEVGSIVTGVTPGDLVAVHWGVAVDRLDRRQAAGLERIIRRTLSPDDRRAG